MSGKHNQTTRVLKETERTRLLHRTEAFAPDQQTYFGCFKRFALPPLFVTLLSAMVAVPAVALWKTMTNEGNDYGDCLAPEDVFPKNSTLYPFNQRWCNEREESLTPHTDPLFQFNIAMQLFYSLGLLFASVRLYHFFVQSVSRTLRSRLSDAKWLCDALCAPEGQRSETGEIISAFIKLFLCIGFYAAYITSLALLLSYGETTALHGCELLDEPFQDRNYDCEKGFGAVLDGFQVVNLVLGIVAFTFTSLSGWLYAKEATLAVVKPIANYICPCFALMSQRDQAALIAERADEASRLERAATSAL